MEITKEEVLKAFPDCTKNAEEVATALNWWLPKYSINTEKRIDNFLAQVRHETGGLRWWRELGGKSYFNKYEPNTSIGKRLGNTTPGDGYKYRGRGIFQLTGRHNYQTMGLKLGLDLINHPELAEEPFNAVRIACQYWDDRNLNRFADIDDATSITRRINGGLNGLQDRLKWLKNFSKWVIWGD
jgi:putative chitinase